MITHWLSDQVCVDLYRHWYVEWKTCTHDDPWKQVAREHIESYKRLCEDRKLLDEWGSPKI